MSRKALVVDIDYYQNGGNLFGCVNDAYSVNSVLARNSDGTRNFDVELMSGNGPDSSITRRQLKDKVSELFVGNDDIALFYFAGHGHFENTGGYLLTSECADGDEGLPLKEIVELANRSRVRNKLIVFDSCHSGIAGNPRAGDAIANIGDGVTILTASSADQYAVEKNNSGVFTTLFVDALNGGAANLVGDVTPGSVYAHIDQSLGSWQQQPLFKTNVERFISLRKVQSPNSIDDLSKLTDIFTEDNFSIELDPSFEPTCDASTEENT